MLETCTNCHTPSHHLVEAVKTVGKTKENARVCRDCVNHSTIKVPSEKKTARKAPARKAVSTATAKRAGTRARSTAKKAARKSKK